MVIVLGLGIFTAFPFHEFNQNFFGYQKPPGFFGFTLADWELAQVLAMIFWSSLIYGTLGKKIDYIFIAIISLFSILDFFYTDNVTPIMYLGLIGVAVLGNTLGYMLKVGRRNWFGK